MTVDQPLVSVTSRRPADRRDQILDAAIHLFHQRGYPSTSVDDIGKAVAVSGPAIYRHFDSKESILVEAIRLAADEVHSSNEAARSTDPDPRPLLAAYVRAYVDVALDRSALIAVWRREARHLSSARRTPMSRRLRSWSEEWVDALLLVRGDLDPATATALVSGAIGLITSVATAPGSRSAAADADLITAMALAVLDTPYPDHR